MKNVYFLSEIIALSIFGINAMDEERDLSRAYKQLDEIIYNTPSNKTDWKAIFNFIDQKKDIIDVNKYYTEWNEMLLDKAVEENNIQATETLLRKYKANPNIRPILIVACRNENIPMIRLLLAYGVNQKIKDKAFEYIKTNQFIDDTQRNKILRILTENY